MVAVVSLRNSNFEVLCEEWTVSKGVARKYVVAKMGFQGWFVEANFHGTIARLSRNRCQPEAVRPIEGNQIIYAIRLTKLRSNTQR
jgi:hypothetical protein